MEKKVPRNSGPCQTEITSQLPNNVAFIFAVLIVFYMISFGGFKDQRNYRYTSPGTENVSESRSVSPTIRIALFPITAKALYSGSASHPD